MEGGRTLLTVKDLTVTYTASQGKIRAVDGVSFSVGRGRNFGLVGESGCGKSTVLKAILRVLPRNARVAGGHVLLEGEDMGGLDEEAMRQVRWRRISMITQSAMNALDPVYPVGEQIMEALRAHERVDLATARGRVEEMLALVGIDRERFSEYPHQFSGGMRQRAIIAMSLILSPSLVIADEPTTSLDVIVQDQIFRNIRGLQQRLGFSMLLVTHDMALVIENCAEIGVMYGGKILETGPMREVITRPHHPYTMGLKNAFPNILDRGSELIALPGTPPVLMGALRGCRFASRCPFSTERCAQVEPPLALVGPGHQAACHYTAQADAMRQRAALARTWLQSADPDCKGAGPADQGNQGESVRPKPRGRMMT